MPSDRHDPEIFYHCDCLEEGKEHDGRFYHCRCIEEFNPRDAELATLRQRVAEQDATIATLTKALGKIGGSGNHCPTCDGGVGNGECDPS